MEGKEHRYISGLFSTSCVFDGGVHTGNIASTTPKGTQKRHGKGNAKRGRKKRNNEEKKDERGKREKQVNKNPHTSGVTVVPLSRLTLHPRGGWSRPSKEQNNTNNTAQGSRNSLRLRRQVLLTTSRCLATLSAVSILFSSTVVSILTPHPFRLCESRIRVARRFKLFFSPSTCHLAMSRSATSRVPRYH